MPTTIPLAAMPNWRPIFVFFLWVAALGLPARTLAQSATASGGGEPLLVFAAASTQEAVDAVLDEFRRGQPTVEVKASYGSSAALAQQVQAGAGAALFLSANVRWVDALDREQLVARRCNLLGNRLAVVAPVDSRLTLKEPHDLLQDGVRRLALGEPQAVPAGIYARQSLTTLKLWDRLKPKVVGASDVRHALAYVETGAAEAGIVYATDAATTRRVKVVFELEADSSEPIVYPLALLRSAAVKPAAQRLYAAFQSDAAANIYRRHGFTVRPDAEVRRPEAEERPRNDAFGR